MTNRTWARCLRHGILLPAALSAAMAAGAPAFAASTATVCDARQYGAVADGRTKDTRAIQTAIDDCEQKGGGTVRLHDGTFLSGPIVLKSHITLEVDSGAVLLGSGDHDDYPLTTVLRDQGRQSLISASNAEDIAIDGGGTIDGAGESWWEEARGQKEHGVMGAGVFRPRLMVFDHCRHILIEKVTVQNSPSWQIVPYYSDDVTIRDGRILAPAHSPNTDGIDPFSSHQVTITHMTIDVGDDNVAIKSGQPGSPGPDDPSTDITVTDCVFLHGHGLSIGSEVAGGVENVRAAGIQFQGTANGVRIKSNRDRGADIGNLDFRNITMQDVGTPLLITEYYPHIPEHDTAQPVTRLTPHFHDIHITNLSASDAQVDGVIAGLPESPIVSIELDHVQISGQKGLSIGNATVTAHGLTVQAVEGPPIVLLDHGTLERK
jgi:polygalacturonase